MVAAFERYAEAATGASMARILRKRDSLRDAEPEDEVVQFSEPAKGRYKKLIIRNGRLVGAIMMGDLEKAEHRVRDAS